MEAAILETTRFANKTEIIAHAHDHGQFTCVLSGVVRQETEAGYWILPRQRLVWIPPGTVHASKSKGPTNGLVVFTSASYSRQLPDHVCVLKTSNLLLASLERLTQLANSSETTAALLSRVVMLELNQAEVVGLEIPLPRSPRLCAIAEHLLAEPSDGGKIDVWARKAALSRRSFTRHFEQETGMSFYEWRRRVIAQRATDLLSSGESVSSVALSLGYESVSAFIAMFKRIYGVPPTKFLAARN
jgi:AraC-like DNA-binding protein